MASNPASFVQVTLRLLLVRHGLSSFNREKRIQGRNDLSLLTNEGQRQASLTGEVLADMRIDAIYSSPLKRAVETTNKLLESIEKRPEPIFDNGLLEIDLGPWSGLTVEEVMEKFPEDYQTWKNQPENLVLKHEDGQNYKPIEELIIQAKNFITKLVDRHSPHKNETVILVAHNAILRCLIITLLGGQNQSFRRLQLNNASLSIFNLNPHPFKSYQTQIECLNNITHLSPPLPSKKGNARLILVRHGETDWNRQGRFQGQIDIPLNRNGKSQASAAGEFLKNTQIDQAYSSSMSRPKQTAEEILKYHPGVKLKLKEGLLEIGHGLWEGKLESEIKAAWSELLETWHDSPEKVQMPEGENITGVWERAVKCWQTICDSLCTNETALVVAHDAVNKTILCHLLGLNPSDIWMVKQGNGGVTVIDISLNSSQPSVVTCLNLTSHLGGLLDCTASGAL